MGSEFSLIIDVVTIIAGIFCIVAPEKAYNFGRKEKIAVPASWPMKSRIIGVVLLALAIFFIVLEQAR